MDWTLGTRPIRVNLISQGSLCRNSGKSLALVRVALPRRVETWVRRCRLMPAGRHTEMRRALIIQLSRSGTAAIIRAWVHLPSYPKSFVTPVEYRSKFEKSNVVV